MVNQKTNWKFVAIVVVLAVIVGAGILFWIKTQEFPPAELPEIEISERIVEEETANWKTYRNEEYGFEIKYPEDWDVKIREGFYFIKAPRHMQLVYFKFSPFAQNYSNIDLTVLSNPEKYSTLEWLEKYAPGELKNPFNGDIYINKDKEIGREYGVETSYTQGCQERRAFVAKREFLFVLHTCIGLGQNGEVFNQMLSTFTLY